MDNWEEFMESTSFVQYYRCRPISLLNDQVDNGSRIILPPSALDRLGSLNIEYPMKFKIRNPATEVVSHCGVLEFVADEGFVHVPSSMMALLGIQEDDVGSLVVVKNTSLPKATFLRLQPHAMDFLRRISDPGQLLEYNFRKFPCMTVGETIAVTDDLEGGRLYRLDVVEARPADAVATLETDCEVEFATPLDYKEPEVAAPPPPVLNDDDDDKPPAVARFAAGVGMRLDGKPAVEQEKTADQVAPAASSSSSINGKSVLRFGGVSAPAAAGGGKKKEEIEEKEEVERFTGTKYSLMDESMAMDE